MSITFETYKAPKSKILASISHFESLIDHHKDEIIRLEMEIRSLQNILTDRKMMKAYRERLNAMARSFIKKYGHEINESLVRDIQGEFSCTKPKAQDIADMIKREVRKHDLNKRNGQIVLLSEKMSCAELAKDYGISRQAVHKIIKKHKKSYF